MQRPNTWKEAGDDAKDVDTTWGRTCSTRCLACLGSRAITASVRHDRDQTEIEDAFDITLHYTIDGQGCRLLPGELAGLR